MEALHSFEKVDYPTRPSKQVERKIFLEILHRLSRAGVPIHTYTYIGLGSVFYVDFVLFHRYLYIDDMICAERSEANKRMEFNLPYEFVKLKMGPVSNLIPELKRDQRYLVWLDYDYALDEEILDDVDGFARNLSPGSVLIVTVDAEQRLDEEELLDGKTLQETEEEQCAIMNRAFARHLKEPIRSADLARSRLPVVFSKILRSQLETSASSQKNCIYQPLFNYRYADGAQMLTVGGIIADPELQTKLLRSGILKDKPETALVNTRDDPVVISVPPLTFREKEWLDQHIRKAVDVKGLPFELKPEALAAYVKYYRHYPAFRDILL